MDLQLSGKRALITGSTSGIGEQIAKTLAIEGASVVIHGRREGEAQRVADAITEAGGKAAVAIGDLGCDGEATKVVEAAASKYSP